MARFRLIQALLAATAGASIVAADYYIHQSNLLAACLFGAVFGMSVWRLFFDA
jgi:hypothetical protein